MAFPAPPIVPSADPSWDLKVPEGKLFSYNPEKAKSLLDEAGWIDSNGDGTRDKDGEELRLRYFDRSEGDGGQNTDFLTGWLRDVGIATEVDDDGRRRA